MRIGILSFDIATGSGQSRFAVNLSRGLLIKGFNVTIFAYSCSSEDAETLRKYGIDVYAYKEKLKTIDLYREISDSRKVFSEMLRMVRSADKCDFYLVLNDSLVGISNYKEGGKWIYLSQGDMTLLFLNQRFLDRYYPYSLLLKRRFVTQLIRHQKSVMNYDYLFANSQFTRSIMSFILNANFTNYVYPPVDTEFFKPVIKNSEENYVLAMLRNNTEPMYQAVQRIARAVPVKIVGNARVEGAVTLGRIPEQELVELYSNARLTIGSSMQEYFGYSTAESFACGTPVLAFNLGGAAEMIDNNKNGWLVETQDEMIHRVTEIFNRGYEEGMRENARKSSEKFSIPASTEKFLDALQ